MLVLDVFARQRVLDFGRRHLFAVFAEGADAVVFVIPVPVVARAEQREDAAVEIAPAGGEGDRRSLAPLRAVGRARARGEIRERHRFDVGRFRQIRGLHRVEQRAGIEPRVIEEKPEPHAVRVGVEPGGRAPVDVAHVEGVEAVVQHLVLAILGTADEELLHPFPFVEFVDRDAAERIDLVGKALLVEFGLDIRPPVHVDADRGGEEVVVTDGGLFLVVVGHLQPDRADALLHGHRGGVEGPVLPVEGTAEIVALGIARETLGPDGRAGGIAHGHVEEIPLD